MREFTQKELDLIIENENDLSLKDLSNLLNCTWKDVYLAYSAEIKKPEYKERVKEYEKK